MAKQTIYITSAADLSIKNSQLQITFPDRETSFQRSIEDLGTLIIDHHSAHLTVPLLNRLAEQNVAVVFCNETHTPTTMLMDLESNCLQAKHTRAQIEAGKPLCKQVWKQIVEFKIRNQSALLEKLGYGNDPLHRYHTQVKSGDSTNREGAAAKIYWQMLFGKQFIRDRIGTPPNNLLNYGYAILRSSVARAIMDAGLLPMIGVFHRNYYDAFPLADDLMEPFRPFIDEKVFTLHQRGIADINLAVKREIIEIFYQELSQDQISATAHSLVRLFEKEGNVICYPTLK
ncbi:MAG: type II CRISPR-associated endonuclease Cas1 [Bacteroidales bacterium]|nr:type II CRISPR-associated endonuclease Cas1 [Bacteroidales bacterium]